VDPPPPALRVVPHRVEDQRAEQQHREQLAAVAHRGEEDAGADDRQQHRADRLAVDPAGQHPLELGAAPRAPALRGRIGRDDQPGQPVQEQAQTAGEAEHRRHHPEDHRVDVQVPAQTAADPGHHAVALGPGQRRAFRLRRGCGPGLLHAVVFGHAPHPGVCRPSAQPAAALPGP
jgi:hypothetical protein